MATPTDSLGQALDATGRLVESVTVSEWAAPTPCTEWTVRELVNHLVGGNLWFAELLATEGQGARAPSRPSGDVLGEDPVASYRRSADALVQVFARPGVLEQVFPLPIGDAPGAVALHLRTVEAMAHGWDLARAIGKVLELPEDMVEPELEWSRAAVAGLPAGRRPFADAQPVADEAPAIDRLAACLGRAPAAPSRYG